MEQQRIPMKTGGGAYVGDAVVTQAGILEPQFDSDLMMAEGLSEDNVELGLSKSEAMVIIVTEKIEGED